MRFLPPLLLLLTLSTLAERPTQAKPAERGRPAFLFEPDNPTFATYELRGFLTTVDREAARLLGRKVEGKPVEVSIASKPIARPRFVKGPQGNMSVVFPKNLAPALADSEVARRMIKLNLLARLDLAPSKRGDSRIEWAVIAIERKLRRAKSIPPMPMAASFVGVHALALQGVELKAAPVAAGPPPPAEDVYFRELHAELCEILVETVVTARGGQDAARELLKQLHQPDQPEADAWNGLSVSLMDALDSAQAPDKAEPSPGPSPDEWLDERFNLLAFALSVNNYLPADTAYCAAKWEVLTKNLERLARRKPAAGEAAPAPLVKAPPPPPPPDKEFKPPENSHMPDGVDFKTRSREIVTKRREVGAAGPSQEALAQELNALNVFHGYCPFFLKPPVAALSRAAQEFRSEGDAAEFLAALSEAKEGFAAALGKQRGLEAYLDEQTIKHIPPGRGLAPCLDILARDRRLADELWPELSDYLDSQANP